MMKLFVSLLVVSFATAFTGPAVVQKLSTSTTKLYQGPQQAEPYGYQPGTVDTILTQDERTTPVIPSAQARAAAAAVDAATRNSMEFKDMNNPGVGMLKDDRPANPQGRLEPASGKKELSFNNPGVGLLKEDRPNAIYYSPNAPASPSSKKNDPLQLNQVGSGLLKDDRPGRM